MNRFSPLALVGLLGIAACANDAPTSISSADIGPGFSESGLAAGSFEHIVIGRSGRLPNNLVDAVAAHGGTVADILPQIGVALVHTANPNFAAALARIGGIQAVVPDIQFIAEDPIRESIQISFEEAASFLNPPALYDPINVFHHLQWGHVAVRAIDAWNAGYEGAGVRVAVIDNGINSSHPDIAPNLNTTLSRSFVPGELYNMPAGSHGTHVAGTIAASRAAGRVIGIAPKAEIVALKSLSAITGRGSSFNTMAAIVYAGDIGADVINMSLGSFLPTRGSYTYVDNQGNTIRVTGAEIQEFLQAYQRAVDYAHRQGATIISSAGNDSRDLQKVASGMALPAGLRNVISVSALGPMGWGFDQTTDLDVLASYSNFGSRAITFGAPGGNFDLPTNASCTMPVTGSRACWIHDGVLSSTAAGWGWNWGTSMASPHVAGVAALIIGKNGGSMRPQAVLQALRQGADDVYKPGKDAETGYGRVNAIRSLR